MPNHGGRQENSSRLAREQILDIAGTDDDSHELGTSTGRFSRGGIATRRRQNARVQHSWRKALPRRETEEEQDSQDFGVIDCWIVSSHNFF